MLHTVETKDGSGRRELLHINISENRLREIITGTFFRNEVVVYDHEGLYKEPRLCIKKTIIRQKR